MPSIEVIYTGGIRWDLDRALEAAATKLKGRHDGAGCCLMGKQERDISFSFKDAAAAKKFQTQAKKILKAHGAKVK